MILHEWVRWPHQNTLNLALKQLAGSTFGYKNVHFILMSVCTHHRGHINDVWIIQKVPWYSYLTNKPVDHLVENSHLFSSISQKDVAGILETNSSWLFCQLDCCSCAMTTTLNTGPNKLSTYFSFYSLTGSLVQKQIISPWEPVSYVQEGFWHFTLVSEYQTGAHTSI